MRSRGRTPMRKRVLTWVSVGFLVASAWIFYTFVVPPDFLGASMRNPFVEALAFTSCPITIAGRYFPLQFWWIPPANAASYGVVGLTIETLRWKLNQHPLPERSTS